MMDDALDGCIDRLQNVRVDLKQAYMIKEKSPCTLARAMIDIVSSYPEVSTLDGHFFSFSH